MNTKEQGTEYEEYVQKIFELLHKMDGVENLKIQHNVILQGRSGAKHQIDVFWKFCLAGITYQVVIECKRWSGPVPQQVVAGFQSVLTDLDAGTQGILVSASGFTSGADRMAKAAGIRLMEIHPSTADNLDGLITKVPIHVVIPWILNTKVRMQMDKKWAAEHQVHAGEVMNGPNMFIRDSDRDEVYTVKQLMDRLCEDGEPGHKELDREFTGDAWLVDLDTDRKVKLLRVFVSFDYVLEKKVIEINFEEQMKNYVRDLTTGRKRFLGEVFPEKNEERKEHRNT